MHALSEFTEHRVPRATRTRRTSTSDVERQGRQRPGPASPLKGRSPRRSIRPPGSWVVSGGEWNRRLWRRLARDPGRPPPGSAELPRAAKRAVRRCERRAQALDEAWSRLQPCASELQLSLIQAAALLEDDLIERLPASAVLYALGGAGRARPVRLRAGGAVSSNSSRSSSRSCLLRLQQQAEAAAEAAARPCELALACAGVLALALVCGGYMAIGGP